MFASTFLGFAAACVAATLAAPASSAVPPTVQLDDGTFTGSSDGTTDSFLGIKFADAPRFNLPVPVGPYAGARDVTAFGPACPQQGSDIITSILDELSKIFGGSTSPALANMPPPSEDCFNLNVWVPAGMNSTSRLPVVVWIFGGGFEGGSATDDGGVIVKRSIELGEPVVYVGMNYRVSAFGFIAGQEVKDAGVGNIGLEDQRVALQWVQKYIAAFGGDPDNVTIWGESAGAISVSLHMLTNGGDTGGLFHRAFMQSGAPIPVGDISRGQADYDQLVQDTSCGDALDTLQCLRALPYHTIKQAVDQSPSIINKQSLRLAWLPRVDGRFLTDTPQNLVLKGSVAPIPLVSGNVNDEGTVFSLVNSLTVWSDADFRSYMLSNYIEGASESDVDTLYPNDPTKGSPFDTGTNYSFHFQYKRLAAIQGDLFFQAPRRFFVEHTYNRQPNWSFLSKRKPTVEILGIEIGRLGAVSILQYLARSNNPPIPGPVEQPSNTWPGRTTLQYLARSNNQQKTLLTMCRPFQYHGSDLTDNVYAPGDMTDYLVHFVNHGDPNDAGSNLINWPRYDNETRRQLTFVDDTNTPLVIETDTYRVDGFNKLTELSLRFPL